MILVRRIDSCCFQMLQHCTTKASDSHHLGAKINPTASLNKIIVTTQGYKVSCY